MKKLLFASLLGLAISSQAQTTKKEVTLTIDSAHVYALLILIQNGQPALMQTAIPANQVTEIQKKGQDIFEILLPKYMGWKPASESKTDSTGKK